MTLSKRLSVAVFPCPTQDLPGIFVSKSGMGLHARGGWSDVWRGELHDENNGTIEAVAVKILLGIDMGYGPEAEALQSERLQKVRL
ncbi:hypothetical protein FRB98_007323 [Tulasnella sp. 332]|nr:hypothetical protein FRB98_007323 [Tulasnella sp. 332]